MSDRVEGLRDNGVSVPFCRIAVCALALLLSGCAEFSGTVSPASGLISLLNEDSASQAAATPDDPRKAAEYWSKVYAQKPRDAATAITYAKSLKAIGQKARALAVLQQASLVHGRNKTLASEYGRLALELNQISTAKKLLEIADDPVNPDWRVVLGRGTVLAREGRYKEALSFYERAQLLQPDHPSVLNNLALAYTMSGEAAKGEEILRRAVVADGARGEVRQNLALVLGIRGKYDEAKAVGASDLPAASAVANTDLLRKIVKVAPQASGPDQTVSPASVAAVQPPKASEPAPHKLPPILKASAEVSDEPRQDGAPKVAASAVRSTLKPASF
jgi:Flp pilus assembly protein TadD